MSMKILGTVLGGIAGELFVLGIMFFILGSIILSMSGGLFSNLLLYMGLPFLIVGIILLMISVVMMYLKFMKLKIGEKKGDNEQSRPKKSYTPHPFETEWVPQVECPDFKTQEDAKQFYTSEGPVKICQSRKTCYSFDAKACFAKEVKRKV
jgi:hypothetical protein